jgi:hypothetical protein
MAALNTHFCPPEGDLEPFLAVILEIGGVVVDLDGLVVPRIGDPRSEVDLRAATSAAVAASGPVAPLHPGRHARYRMEVAYLSDIVARDQSEIAEYLASAEIGKSESRNRPDRFRGQERLRAKGRGEWADAGGWPWVLYPDGRLPVRWRQDPDVARSLATWHQNATHAAGHELARLRARLARARHLHAPRDS